MLLIKKQKYVDWMSHTEVTIVRKVNQETFYDLISKEFFDKKQMKYKEGIGMYKRFIPFFYQIDLLEIYDVDFKQRKIMIFFRNRLETEDW